LIPENPHQKAALISLVVILPLGLLSKFYSGPGALWSNNSLGGVFYVIFWCLLVYLIMPEKNTLAIAAGILAITCALEFMQLWHPPFLEWVRETFIGRSLIGHSFTWRDFPYYFIGAGLALIWMDRIKKKYKDDSWT